MQIRSVQLLDCDAIFGLYREVARRPGGLARLEDEVTPEYIQSFVAQSLQSGICLVAEDKAGQIAGEIHAYSPGLYCFSHVLSELTIAVSPDAQGGGVGRQLFETLMEEVDCRQEILRVELIARESNTRAIRFYETLGFVREGEMKSRIKNVDGTFESDIPMAWVRPG